MQVFGIDIALHKTAALSTCPLLHNGARKVTTVCDKSLTMATPKRLVHRKLLDSTLQQCRAPPCRNSFARVRSYATEPKKEEEERDSFKGQLYQSTFDRLQREREEQAKFTQQREAQKAARGAGGSLISPLGKWTKMLLD